jgi:acetylornithine deacetylase/succinyl-diaminopimelate desuccinylase-like protein
MNERIQKVHQYSRTHAREVIQELIDFLRVPNNVYRPEQIQASAQHLRAMLERRGIQVEMWPTPSGRPTVFGELPTPGATKTLLIYTHYDGVPAERKDWHSDPYQPVLRTQAGPDWSEIAFPVDGVYAESWRLFGRSVADSKNGIVAVLSALDALRAQGQEPGVNLKFFIDGEEEHESPGLPACIAEHRDRLAADLLVMACGETHQSGLPTVDFGVRGMLMLDLTVYTTTVALHSGHFGNFGPNAALGLARLLSGLKDEDGRVLVPGFYDDVMPLSQRERDAIAAIPRIEPQLREQFGIARPEGAGLLQELINQPSLNVRGMTGGFVGEQARNIIPHVAQAEIDIRLVYGMDPDRTFRRISEHLAATGWTVLDREPTRAELLASQRVVKLRRMSGFPAVRTPLDTPLAAGVLHALEEAVDEPLVVMPSEGGSVPLHMFDLPLLGLPTSNFDCNQHTADENLHLKHLFRGINLFAALLGSRL